MVATGIMFFLRENPPLQWWDESKSSLILFFKIFFVYLHYYQVGVSTNYLQGVFLENWDSGGLLLCEVKVRNFPMLPNIP